jgi:hypothetical protein
VISRFVDRSWQLVGEQEREQYLRRLETGIVRSGWRLVGYALMSSHIHVLAEASHTPLAAWAKPVHVGMAQWLNRRFGRLGPVFADRPYCEIVAPSAVPVVLAYVHNNPVRARIVAAAVDSTWTSHRAYLGLEHSPAGLDVPHGLSLCGFASDAAGRAEFADWVDACARTRQEAVSAPREVSGVRRAARERFSSAIELGTATRGVTGASFALLSPSNRPVPTPIELDPRDILAAVLATSGISLDHHPYGRPRALSRARRAALAIWGLTGRPRSTMVRALGITSAAATKLAQSASERDPQLAALVTNALELLGHPPAGTL